MRTKALLPIIILCIIISPVFGQIESYWYSDPDAVGFKEDNGGTISNASTWQPRIFTLTRELGTSAFFNSLTPSDLTIAETGGAGALHLSRLTHRSLLFDEGSAHRAFLDKDGLELLNDTGQKTVKAYTRGAGGQIDIYRGSASQWLARLGATELGINRGSLRLYGSDGFEKIEITVDADNDPMIEAGKGLSVKSSNNTTADLILRGNDADGTNGVIESDPDYTNSNLIFKSRGSILFDLDIDESTPGIHPFVVSNAGNQLLTVSEDRGVSVQRISGLVSEPHVTIRDFSADGYGRLNIGNVNQQNWQIAGKPTGASTTKFLLFHLTETNGTTGQDMLQLRGDGNAYLRGTYETISDIRLKKDIVKLENSLDGILKLSGYNYNWKEASKPLPQTGVIAQEVQEVFPQLVSENKNGELSVNYDGLIPHLIESIKSQQNMIEQLQKEVLNLKSN